MTIDSPATAGRPSLRAAVLGGAGFLGSHLTAALLDRGATVRVFDRPNADLKALTGIAQHTDRWSFVPGDFVNEADQQRVVNGIDVVYHVLSTTIPATSNANPAYDVASNLVSTVNLLAACVASGVQRVVFVSSGGTVYGKPQELPIPETHGTTPWCSYGIVKVAIEHYLRLFHHLHGLRYTIARLSNPYGPHQRLEGAQGAASVLLARAHSGRPIEIWGDGSVVRDFVFVEDAVEGILAAATRGGDAGVFNIGSGVGTSLNELVEAILRVADREVTVDHHPGRPFDVPVNVLDVSHAREALDWQPTTSLENGLRRTWQWLDERDVAAGAEGR